MRHLNIVPTITRDARSLQKYLSEINQFPLITIDEEIRLARRIRAGDRKALEQLVCANLRFVISVAKQYQHTGLPLMDLISEGNIGLVMAAERFDASKGFKFISYAVWWIRKLILMAIAEQGRLVRLPASKTRELLQLREMMDRLSQQLDREPTVEELADALVFRIPNVRELLGLQARRQSLDAPLETDEDLTLLAVLSDREVPAPDAALTGGASQRQEIDQLLRGVSKREAWILRRYFGMTWGEGRADPQPDESDECSLEDISTELGLSKERVRVLKNRALLKLRVRGASNRNHIHNLRRKRVNAGRRRHKRTP